MNSLAVLKLIVMARSSGFSVGFDQAVVRILIQQLSHCIGIGGFKAEEPTFAHRVFVDQLGAAIELVVDYEDFAVQRHVDATRGLDRFNGGGFCALLVGLQLRQLHENHITQRVLRESGDTHGDAAIGFGAQPFVIFSETQLAHGNSSGPDSSGGRDWNNGELLSNIAANLIKSLQINWLMKLVRRLCIQAVAISLQLGGRKKAYVDQSLAWRAKNRVVAISLRCSAFSTADVVLRPNLECSPLWELACLRCRQLGLSAEPR